MAITWNDSWNTKITVIDQQHRKLVNLVNDLGEAMRVGKSKEVVNDVLTVLVDYTKTHFRAEEALMRQHGYSELAEHQKIHEEFVNKVSEFKLKVESGNTVVSIAIYNFLSDWLVNHIKGEDQKYIPILQGKA
ncbi:MAG: bacteriohemerythrin [Deltaproteobacteria bacterium]|nr:bacteriohemerythrin [Deltaproteobacteria bacterium]MBN2673985.1 bacteriohemerythrin [Deltaproteobacteria bacterium]